MLKHFLLSVATVVVTVPLFADPDQIPIRIPEGSSSSNDPQPHSPAQFIAQGYYDLETDVLSLSFLQSIGICTITVTNTAGEYFVQQFDSDWGTCLMNLSGTPGLYIITIQTLTGMIYSGQFLIV